MAKSKAKLPRAKAKAPRVKKVTRAPVMSIAVVEVDPASFPDDLREHAVALAPLVAKLRVIASKRPKQIRIGPPTTRDRVQALATHYQASLRPDYTALMMLADGIAVEDSYRLYSVEELVSDKLTRRSEKLRAGYSDCLPIGVYSLSKGWLFVMAEWGEPYCEKVMSMTMQQKTVLPWLQKLVAAARKLPA